MEVFVEILDAAQMRDLDAVAEGLQIIRTSDGRMVKRLEEKGKYQIVESGKILTSDDPTAP